MRRAPIFVIIQLPEVLLETVSVVVPPRTEVFIDTVLAAQPLELLKQLCSWVKTPATKPCEQPVTL